MADNNSGRGLRWLGPLAGPVDRFLSGGKSSDPFYLSNRTIWQRSRRLVLIVLPLVVITAIVALSSFQLIRKNTPQAKEPSAAEIAARSLPDFSRTSVGGSQDITVLEAEVKEQGGRRVIAGRVRNNTDRRLALVEVTFEAANTLGAQLGAVKLALEDVRPRALVPFELPVASKDTALALVREVRTR